MPSKSDGTTSQMVEKGDCSRLFFFLIVAAQAAKAGKPKGLYALLQVTHL